MHTYTLPPELQSKHEWAGDLSLEGSLDGQWRTAFFTPAEKEKSQEKGLLRESKIPLPSKDPFWSKVL